ncbi:DUF3231 family protein [Desulfosporosinus sp. Sb-LF]|uniref:DUF3231 family protein n=1 Tax=Desulfosporosinus sp. Sb-LF TaxID=2560027 RepID=UPI00107F94A4|nr:DUF3231 family protein [Desulfosporosinus sp. Sb-LF]TGE30942.1 DUF3231 family protein [Desulfosporosinus sp. Sb-LF]
MNDNQPNIQRDNQGVTEQVPFGFGTVHHNLTDLMPASSEVGFLWNNYLAANISTCYLTKWVNEATDPEIKSALQMELDAASNAWKETEGLLKSINYPTPMGFVVKEDIDINAPVLFSQSFKLLFTRMMQRMLIQFLVPAVTSSYRTDFQDYFHNQLKTAADRHRKYTEILLSKGILQKHPSIVQPHRAEKVLDKDFFGSYFGFFRNQRPLTAVEIGHIYSIMEIKQLIRQFHEGCCQVVKSEKVKILLLKARDIADKQLDSLGHILTEQDVPRPSISDILITDSTESGVSDRLILNLSTAVTAFMATSYGEAVSTVARKDIGVTMLRFMAEKLSFAKDAAELAIEFGWLEKMPQTVDRQQLIH